MWASCVTESCCTQIVQLQQKVSTADDKAQRLEAAEQRLKERVRHLERSLEVPAPFPKAQSNPVIPFLCAGLADMGA